MPAIRLSRLKLENYSVVVRPLKGSDVVRTEAKYDRHGFGEVLAANIRDGQKSIKIKPGDIVIYDDSDAIEFPAEIQDGAMPEQVECVDASDIWGVEAKK